MRSVGILVGGTIAANLIAAGSLLFLTRLYTPADFAALAVVTGLIATLAPAAALRFDLAVPLPEDDKDAAGVAMAGLGSVIAVGGTILVLVVLFGDDLLRWFKDRVTQWHLLLVPLGVMAAGFQSVFQFWLLRDKAFPAVARGRLLQAATGSACQIGSGVSGPWVWGLLAGPALGFVMGAVSYATEIRKRYASVWSGVSLRSVMGQASSYHRFPLYSAPEALANSGAIQIPVLMIAALATGPEAGHLLLGMSVIQAPMALIGSAVAQVYLSQAPEQHRKGNLSAFTGDVLSGLIKTGLGPVLFAGLVAPVVFPVVFGPQWARAGELVLWMTPWFALQLLASPVSTAITVSGALRAALVLQLFGLALRPAAVAAAAIVAPDRISEAYALSGAVFYAVYLWTVVRIVGMSVPRSATAARAVGYPLAWALAGGAVLLASRLFKGG